MTELVNVGSSSTIRWKLLTGASVIALAAYTSSLATVLAGDADRPTLWIELGGQFSALSNGEEGFSPALMDSRPAIFEPSQKFERPPRHSFDEEGKISIQPADSNWVFSAAVRYGHAKSSKHNLQQTSPQPIPKYFYGNRYVHYPSAERFADTRANYSEQHLIVDFQAGKDVGVGLFKNPDSTSLFSLGLRFAQFSSSSNVSIKSDPDWHFSSKYFTPFHVTVLNQAFHSNLASLSSRRSFHGLGPSVSWKASVPVAGNLQDGEISADWGINGAILFGRQIARTHHQSTARYKNTSKYSSHHGSVPDTISRFPATPDHTRSRSVVVPNIGGFAGLTFRYNAAKLSFGYRADFFFAAIDGGIDTRKTYDRDFYGPFATIAIGLGG